MINFTDTDTVQLNGIYLRYLKKQTDLFLFLRLTVKNLRKSCSVFFIFS